MAVEYPPAFVREEIDGVKVVKDVVYASPLSKVLGRFVPMHGVRELTLDDESVVYGCRDCPFTGAGPGVVRGHRRADHALAEDGADPKPPRMDGGVGQIRKPGPDALAMTVYEVVDLATHIETLSAAMESLDDENQRLRAQVADERRTHREELAVVRAEHRTALGKERDKTRKVTKELDTLKARLRKFIGVEDS